MSTEAEVEDMAMPGVRNLNAECMDAVLQEGGDVTTEVVPVAIPPAKAPKASLPVLDLLHWSESSNPNPRRTRFSATNDSSAFMNASNEWPLHQPTVRSEVRTSQPAGGISTISFREDSTLDESQQMQKRRPTSDSKRREMIGSRIFEQQTASESAPEHLAKIPLAAANTDGLDLSPIKPASVSEVAKQRERSRMLFSATDTPGGRRPCSSAKSRELEGSNIFGRSIQDPVNAASAKEFARDLNKAAGATYQENYAPPRTSIKVSNPAGGRSQISFGCDGGDQQFGMQSKNQEHIEKAAELSGHSIINGEANSISSVNSNSTSPCERMVSAAKRRELLGNDIFSDENPFVSHGHPRSRQPPGGESNVKLF